MIVTVFKERDREDVIDLWKRCGLNAPQNDPDDPDYRRMGYGRVIMNEIEHKLNSLGCPKINLQVRETNVSVIKFYEALGFKNDNVISFGKRLEEE
ncbi:MAG: GNAT family N-acetyltransferase [Deltaproteobacteria bacterium]|nr:GNAT family N-acetyltransferase [Deltaproteobacteria bacterium]